jgi:hypothetical protein
MSQFVCKKCGLILDNVDKRVAVEHMHTRHYSVYYDERYAWEWMIVNKYFDVEKSPEERESSE